MTPQQPPATTSSGSPADLLGPASCGRVANSQTVLNEETQNVIALLAQHALATSELAKLRLKVAELEQELREIPHCGMCANPARCEEMYPR